MKKTRSAAIIVIFFLIMPALIIAADNPAPAKPSSCGKCEATDMFQSANDTIKGFHPKPCILQPVKSLESVKPGQIPWFQKFANDITGRNTSLPDCGEQKAK